MTMTTCKACSSGFYQDGFGKSSCKTCASGEESTGDLTACINCAAGNFSTAGSFCEHCVAGRYSSVEASRSCQICEEGKSSTVGSADCSACPLGRMLVTLTPILCAVCPAGKYQDAPQMDINIGCKDCDGSYIVDAGLTEELHDAMDDCQHCTAGKEFVSKTEECRICDAGRYQDANNVSNAVCQLCPLGRYIDIQAVDQCTITNTTDASAVALVRSPTKHDSVNDCKTCPKGYEINGTDVTKCHVCGYSKYQDQIEVVNVKCKTCLKNSYITDDGGAAVTHDQDKDCGEFIFLFLFLQYECVYFHQYY